MWVLLKLNINMFHSVQAFDLYIVEFPIDKIRLNSFIFYLIGSKEMFHLHLQY